jgi:tRNA (guanine37-N1)-methyltransferase
MFAGVCPFSILIAKRKSKVYVYSSEINPDAYDLMVENIVLNRVENKVIPLLGDAILHSKELTGVVDRVLMPLPEKALEALPIAYKEVKDGGVVHVYLHLECEKKICIETAMKLVSSRVSGLKPSYGRIVREVAPRVYQVVVDAVKLGAGREKP